MDRIGKEYSITLLGSSHGKLVGVIVEGVPAGTELDVELINMELHRRRPGQSRITTERIESDSVIVETGIIDGKATGEPILAFVKNKDVDSSYYDTIKNTPRPGHADFTNRVKYKDHHDHRGGGRASGRMTVGLVIAGAIAKQMLRKLGIEVYSYTKSIAQLVARPINITEEFIYSDKNLVRVPDENLIEPFIDYVTKVKEEGDSCGGIVECQILGLPVGVGEPWFDSIESKLSHIIFSIPAVKGVEFGSGFAASKMKGSEHNDEFTLDEEGKIVTETNNAGGILGGLSNGMPVIFRTVFKPTSSIKKEQKTVDIKNKTDVSFTMEGRHDPCIVPRAVPVVSNAAACVILDLILSGGYYQIE